MATSAYSNFLSNPELIPRMSGESVDDALARVQGWHDASIAKVDRTNALRAGAGWGPESMTDYGAPLPVDNYVPGSTTFAESVLRLQGGSNYTPRTEVLPENYNKIYNPNTPGTPNTYNPATGQVTAPGGTTPKQQLLQSRAPTAPPAPGNRGYNISRQTVGAAGNDMLGAGNADYQSELIRGLRNSNPVRQSTNPGVTMTTMTPKGGGVASPAPAPSAGGSIFSPEIVQPDLASADDVANWADYSAYRIGQVGQSQPSLSFQDWLAQRGAAPAPAPATPPGPTAPPINWNENFA